MFRVLGKNVTLRKSLLTRLYFFKVQELSGIIWIIRTNFENRDLKHCRNFLVCAILHIWSILYYCVSRPEHAVRDADTKPGFIHCKGKHIVDCLNCDLSWLDPPLVLVLTPDSIYSGLSLDFDLNELVLTTTLLPVHTMEVIRDKKRTKSTKN